MLSMRNNLMKKILRYTIPRAYVLDVMQKHQDAFLEVRDIYINMYDEKKISLSVVYRASRELYEAGLLERQLNERSGRISYRHKSSYSSQKLHNSANHQLLTTPSQLNSA
ncbi:transcriptional repressor [Sodalis sp. RH23]|uniref:transcriptional repressor n=1 Tax=unclassified Sodalis (in: enterobacteria) TaxID=2636512 RepID=UPI0039B57921